MKHNHRCRPARPPRTSPSVLERLQVDVAGIDLEARPNISSPSRPIATRHVKHVPGRKSDVQDCEWVREFHSVGLLRGSFRPAAAIRALCAVLHHRDTLGFTLVNRETGEVLRATVS